MPITVRPSPPSRRSSRRNKQESSLACPRPQPISSTVISGPSNACTRVKKCTVPSSRVNPNNRCSGYTASVIVGGIVSANSRQLAAPARQGRRHDLREKQQILTHEGKPAKQNDRHLQYTPSIP